MRGVLSARAGGDGAPAGPVRLVARRRGASGGGEGAVRAWRCSRSFSRSGAVVVRPAGLGVAGQLRRAPTSGCCSTCRRAGSSAFPTPTGPLVLLWQAAARAPPARGPARLLAVHDPLLRRDRRADRAGWPLRLLPGEHALALLGGCRHGGLGAARLPAARHRPDRRLRRLHARDRRGAGAVRRGLAPAGGSLLLAAGMARPSSPPSGSRASFPSLALAPLLIGGRWQRDPRRFVQWALAWIARDRGRCAGSRSSRCCSAGPRTRPEPWASTPSPFAWGSGLLQLSWMQIGPLVTTPLRELAVRAVPLAATGLPRGRRGPPAGREEVARSWSRRAGRSASSWPRACSLTVGAHVDAGPDAARSAPRPAPRSSRLPASASRSRPAITAARRGSSGARAGASAGCDARWGPGSSRWAPAGSSPCRPSGTPPAAPTPRRPRRCPP